MSSYWYIRLACLLVLAPSAHGGIVQPLIGLPDTYYPGQVITFSVQLPAMNDLGSYNIDVVVESSTGVAGADLFFDLGSTTPAPESYVFPSAANFSAATTVDSSTRQRLTLTDFDFDGARVIVGSNDQIAIVTLNTLPTCYGPLSLYVDVNTLIFDTPAISPTPVEGFAGVQAGIAAAGPLEVVQVPEPHFLAIVLTAMTAAWGRRRRGIGGRLSSWGLQFRPRRYEVGRHVAPIQFKSRQRAFATIDGI